MKILKCIYKICDYCKNFFNFLNYLEDEYDYLVKGRFNCRWKIFFICLFSVNIMWYNFLLLYFKVFLMLNNCVI